MRKFGPWSYAINYDAEIANDLREIEALTRVVELQLFLPEKWRAAGFTGNLFFLVLDDADAAARLGLSLEDRAALALHADRFDAYPELDNVIPKGSSYRDWYLRGDAARAKLAWYPWTSLLTEAQAKEQLKKAKASLARHRRNKTKNG